MEPISPIGKQAPAKLRRRLLVCLKLFRVLLVL